MIVYYDENDLVSFGNYMLSETRKKSIIDNPEITNSPTRKMVLQNVTNFDMGNWHRIRVEAERRLEMEEAGRMEDSETPMFSDEMPVDQDGNPIEINPDNWVDAPTSDNTVQLNPSKED